MLKEFKNFIMTGNVIEALKVRDNAIAELDALKSKSDYLQMLKG